VACVLFDLGKEGSFSIGYEGKCNTLSTCAPCSADAVDIVLNTLRKIEVNHMSNCAHVDAAGCNIRCNEDINGSLFELAKSSSSAPLRHITVQRCCLVTTLFELLAELISVALCRCKDNCML